MIKHGAEGAGVTLRVLLIIGGLSLGLGVVFVLVISALSGL